MKKLTLVIVLTLLIFPVFSQIGRKPITPDLSGAGATGPGSMTTTKPAGFGENQNPTEKPSVNAIPNNTPPIIIQQPSKSEEVMISKPRKDNILVEGVLELSFGNNPIGINFTELKGRYFATNEMAYRARINAHIESLNKEIQGGKLFVGTVTNSTQNISAGGGIEIHVDGSKRVSPYYGAEALIILNSTKITGNNTNDAESYSEGYSYSREDQTSGIYFGALAGLDYYLSSDFYLGTEIRFGFSSLRVSGVGETVSLNGVVVAGSADPYSGGGIKINTDFTRGIRMGYKF